MSEPNQQVVLSLFPGADLFGRAFESRGFCVVRGPELLLGQDIRDFHVPPDRFDGVIGGPPCQVFSTWANLRGTKAVDLIGEFARIVEEARPVWGVMENLRGALRSPHLPKDWHYRKIRDYDCGGRTWRTRLFWLWPFSFFMSFEEPTKRRGTPEYTLLASDGRRGSRGKFLRCRQGLTKIPVACATQGFPELENEFCEENGKTRRFMTHEFGVHLLGNGVPRAMGEWVADQVVRWLERGSE